MIKQSVITLFAALSLLLAGASLAQAGTAGQEDSHSSNANADAPAPMAHADHMMHKHMMKKKMHHKAM